MQKVEPNEYNFMPNTWVLPQEYGYFQSYAKKLYRQGANTCFIQKPANGAMGHGIRLYRNANQVPSNINDNITCVIQEYIDNPLLIDGYKCDLRVYVLITSCDPLRIFMYNDGLVRLGAEKYVKPNEPDGDSVYRHLTNYAVNKHHAEYNRSADEMSGSKRSFTFFNNYIRDVKQCNPLDIWHKIRDLIVKTIAIALPHLLHSYRMCRHKSNHFSNAKLPKNYYLNKQTSFNGVNEKCSISNELNNELKSNLSSVQQQQQQQINNKDSSQHLGAKVKQSTKASKRYRDSNEYLSTPFVRSNLFEILGFDILLDKNLNPWLIEVNRSPSFNSDQELDRRVKHGLLTDTFRLLNIRPSDKSRTEKQQKLSTLKRLCNQSTPTTKNWMMSKAHNEGIQNILKASFHQSENSKNSQLPFPNNTKSDFVRSVIGQFQLEESKFSWKINCLRQQLFSIRQQLALEFYEHHNSGNWRRIFPTDDPTLQKKYASMIISNFGQFLHRNRGDLLDEMKTTYLNPITEDDIFNKLSKLMKSELKSKPGINTEEHLTQIWSQCIDNYPISDNDIDDVDDPVAFDDDIDMKHTDSDDFYSFTKKKEVNKRNQNKIKMMDHLKNTPITSLSPSPPLSPTSSSSRTMMNTVISKKCIPDYSYSYIPKNNKHKSYSSSTLSSIQLFNEKCKPTDEQIKLSFGRRYKSCEFHALNNKAQSKCNKRQFMKKITSSSNITSSRCSNFPPNVYSSSLEHLNNNWDVQYSMGKYSSLHRNNNNNNNSDEEKSVDLESPVNVKLGKNEVNILLDFDKNDNELQNFKITTSYHSNKLFNDQSMLKRKCSIPIIHWNCCTLNDLLPSSSSSSFRDTLKQSTRQKLVQCLKHFEEMIQNQMNLSHYYSCINILANEMMEMLPNNSVDELNLKVLSLFDKEDVLQFFNVQCDNERRNIIHQNDELINSTILACFHSLNLAQIQIQLEEKEQDDSLLNEKKIFKLFTKNLMNKFVQGLRITRLLNRIKCRLLMGHGHLLRNLIQMITKF
ncbi:unnamed protein product [Trichobilharzia szidati]|nr:unnamed protein product [Trichobilharzia szidati]